MQAVRSIARVVVVVAAVYGCAALVNTDASGAGVLAFACLAAVGALVDRLWLLPVPVVVAVGWTVVELAGAPDPDGVNPLPAGFFLVLLVVYGLIASLALATGFGLGRLTRRRIRTTATWRALHGRTRA